MIKVQAQAEPEGFDGNIRQPGRDWLATRASRPIKYPRKYWNEWRPCREALEQAFVSRCGYAACRISSGQVEHFISWKRCDATHQRELAYEWTHYRWILPQLNGRKGVKALLDPFEVEDDWFEIDLFSLNLELTERVPDHLRSLAEHTMKELGLERDSLLLKLRKEALDLYTEGTSMRHIVRCSPLVARALTRLMEAEPGSLSPARRRLRATLERKRSAALRLGSRRG